MRLAVAMLLGLFLAVAAGFQPGAPRPDAELKTEGGIRFEALDVFVESGATPLAAWQVEIKATGDAKLVGVEGGDGVYKDAPYYDPAALHESQLRERIVLAAFSTAGGEAGLPSGKARVARVHVQAGGPVTYTVSLMTAGGADGTKIPARATASPASGPGDAR